MQMSGSVVGVGSPFCRAAGEELVHGTDLEVFLLQGAVTLLGKFFGNFFT